MSILDAIDRYADVKAASFIAPIPDAEHVRVYTKQEGVTFTFLLPRNTVPGWYWLQPNGKRVRVDRPAYATEYIGYLDRLPRFYVFPLFAVSETAWLCMPYNASDARQRGWYDGQPRPLHLVSGSLEPLTLVDARSLAGTLLYNTVAYKSREVSRDLSAAQAVVDAYQKNLEDEMRKKDILSKIQTEEERIRYQLEYVGARLINWRERGEQYVVTWEYNSHRHTMLVRRDLYIASAGLCLSGRDIDYNLSAIVSVIEEAHRLNRPFFDVERDNRDMEDDEDW